jgi:hypothetical protein
MSKASDAGKSFLAGVFAKLPESLRSSVESAFAAADAESALEVIGTGALAQPEISRRLDELRSQQDELEAKRAESERIYQQQAEWWKANEPKVKAYDQIKPEYDRLKTGGTGVTTTGNTGPSAEDLRKEFEAKLAELQSDGMNVMGFMTTLGVQHFKDFGELINWSELRSDRHLGKPMPDGRTYGLQQAYEAKYGEQITARRQKAEAERIDKLVEERWKERMKSSDQPFPLRNQAPSVLDVLENATDGPEKHTLDTAASLYEQLAAQRG